jgi:hypothetical protein
MQRGGSFCLLLILIGLAVTDVNAQFFVPTGRMTRARNGHSATLLQDGRVLIAGGCDPFPLSCRDSSSSAEIYDPDSETFSETGSMIFPRRVHSAVLLLDGRVLIVGGCSGDCSGSAELYDSASGTFSRTGDMSVGQPYTAAVLLRSGKVLVVGYRTAQLFDPASGMFTSVSAIDIRDFVYNTTLLVDGTVLINSLSGVSIYDPVSNQFWNLPRDLQVTGSPAAPLLDGSVAVAGGYDPSSLGDVAFRQNVLYDPSTQTFQVAPRLTLPRAFHTATLLKDGRLLIAGGYDGGFGIFSNAEMYDRASGKISLLAQSMVLHRDGHQATLLRDGRVLITGGETAVDSWRIVADTRAELFVPDNIQGAVPRLSVDRTRYCVGDRWILHADAVAPLSAVQISGTWDGTPWTLPNWTTSGQGGTVAASGTFSADTVGDYWVWLYAGGKVSNSVSIRIENCSDDFRR